jgi:DNA polymerase-3 subunit gamma/tau
MSLALYRKYRPATFAEVIGQEHVTVPLGNALESGNIHHAYLFSGPRGCGKTSSARIMARSLNCEKGPTVNPCGECQSCKDLAPNAPGSIDVIELDAATHGLVDDARDLREKAFFSPVNSKYKVYIIDEAHQLGPGAANALLKVVEEPPPHVIFIFATTEPDKLISTIRSRTHHYPFRLVPPGLLLTHLEKICQQEKVKVAKGVLPLVVRASGGSVRDSLSILGQLLAGADENGVSYEIAIQLLGFTDGALLDEVVDAIAARDGSTLMKSIDSVIEAGHDPRRFTEDLLERFRDLIIAATVDEASSVLHGYPEDQIERISNQATHIGIAGLVRTADILAEGLTQMRGTTAPRLTLEIIAGRILIPSNDSKDLLARIERLEKNAHVVAPTTATSAHASSVTTPPSSAANTRTPANSAAPVANKTGSNTAPATTPAVTQSSTASSEVKKPAAAKPAGGNFDIAALRRVWPDIIENVKGRRRLTWMLISHDAQILSVDETAITLGIVNKGARDSFMNSGSDQVVREAFIEILGIDKKIECAIDPSVNVVPEGRVDEDPSDVEALSGAALLMKELGAQIVSESEE